MTRKVWNDAAGKLEKRQTDFSVDAFAPPLPATPNGYDVSEPCTTCNAKVGEACGSLLPPFRYLEVPHFSRRRSDR